MKMVKMVKMELQESRVTLALRVCVGRKVLLAVMVKSAQQVQLVCEVRRVCLGVMVSLVPTVSMALLATKVVGELLDQRDLLVLTGLPVSPGLEGRQVRQVQTIPKWAHLVIKDFEGHEVQLHLLEHQD